MMGMPELCSLCRIVSWQLSQEKDIMRTARTFRASTVVVSTSLLLFLVLMVTGAAGADAVRVDHSKITELFLGGILRPVLLIAKAR